MSLGIDIDLHSNNSCCDHTMESSEHSHHENDDDTKGCCDIVCDCPCCGHVFTFNEFIIETPESLSPVSEILIDYSFSYFYKFSSGSWQPPRSSK